MTEPHPEEELSAWIDGELSPDDAGRVSAHLETCVACRDALQQLERIVALHRDLPRPEAPARLTDAAMRIVMARQTASAPGWMARARAALFEPSWPRMALAGAVAATVVAVVLTTQLSQSVDEKSSHRIARGVTADTAPGSRMASKPPALSTPDRESVAPIASHRAPLAEAAADDAAEQVRPNIAGRLVTPNPGEAAQQIRALVLTAGGEEIGSHRQDSAGSIMTMTVPRMLLSQVTRGIGALGRWEVKETRPAEGRNVRLEIEIAGAR